MKLCGYDWPQGETKQVVYIDGQGHVIELVKGWDSLSWQAADLTELTGAPLSNGIALAGYAWSAGRTKQVAYVDDQRHVIELFVAAGAPWQWVDLTELTGAPLAEQGALAGYDRINRNTKQVVYIDGQGHVIELLVAAGAPWQWVDLTELTGAPLLHQTPLTGYGWILGATKQVAYVDDQGQVIELWADLRDQWRYASLTAPMRGGAAKNTAYEETRLQS